MTGATGFAVLLSAAIGWITILQATGFAIGRRIHRWNVVDVIWGLGFVGIALIALAFGGGDLNRRVILAGIAVVWGLRLSWHMHVKTHGAGEDPRYVEFLGPNPSSVTVVRKVFVTQGASQIVVGLPILASAVSGVTSGFGWVVLGIGVAAAVTGFTFEAVGDAQLKAYRADPNRGPVMDRGLWGWTRHPNYFGDACLWWGIWAIAASSGLAALTLFSPVVMTYFLVYATGARRLERLMARREGYLAYQRRTSFFVPRPPRRDAPSR